MEEPEKKTILIVDDTPNGSASAAPSKPPPRAFQLYITSRGGAVREARLAA